MKRMLLALFSAFSIGAYAQITVTSMTFPALGDTLRYAVDTAPPAVNANSAPGAGQQTWDFTALKAHEKFEILFQPANAGANFAQFSGADLVVKDSFSEQYFNRTTMEFQNLGFAGALAGTFGISIIGKQIPALVERRAPLNFFDFLQQNTNQNFAFSTEFIPDSLFGGLLPDSIRYRISTQRTDLVDGYGKCILPSNAVYDVLRERRTTYSNTSIDIWYPFIGWVPASGFFGGLAGSDTTVNYVFLSNTEKEEIAIATYDASGTELQEVQFKNPGLITAVHEKHAPGKANIQAHPNPAIDWVRFDCTNLPADNYTFKIFNIVGNVVWKESHFLSGNRSVKVDLEDFKKGTYLYSLEDRKGNTIATKRLVIIKP